MPTAGSDEGAHNNNINSSDNGGRGEAMIVGLASPHQANDAFALLRSARKDHFDFVVTTLPASSTDIRSDVLLLDSRWWRTSVVGQLVLSGSSSNNDNNNDALTSAAGSLQWAWHMHLPAVILPAISSVGENNIDNNYASWIATQAVIARQHSGQLWLPVTLTKESIQEWQHVYSQIGSVTSSALGIILLLPDATDSNSSTTSAYQAFQLLQVIMGQPLHAVAFQTRQFLTNKQGFPALSKLHRDLLSQLLIRLGHHLRVLLIQDPTLPHERVPLERRGETQCLPYWQYLQHRRQQQPDVKMVLDSPQAQLERDYLDCLQRPLQPLRDHLEFATYETFERDPVKYAQYQQAIALALQDQMASSQAKTIVVLVVGAGRGPLVTCVLEAFQSLLPRPASIKIFAIEKNPSAMIYLHSKAQHDPLWKQAGSNVIKVVQSDLRYLNRDQHLDGMTANIIVSELLGSFGDNELSPECLDPLFNSTNCCSRDTVSIPTSYRAYLAPVSSSHLHYQVELQTFTAQESNDGIVGRQRAFETPYVVRPYRASQMHIEKECWSFAHPAANPVNDERQTIVDFDDFTNIINNGSGYNNAETEQLATENSDGIDCPWTLHGFLGTFVSVLYRNVIISTSPSHEFSTGMFSWFPLYFPLDSGLTVPPNSIGSDGDNTVVRARLWRKVDQVQGRVWYEWSASIVLQKQQSANDAIAVTSTAAMVNSNGNDKHSSTETVLQQSQIHNVQGRSYHVSMI